MVASIDTAQGFDVMLSREDEADLEDAFSGRRGKVPISRMQPHLVLKELVSSMWQIDARNARATHESDKQMIFEKIGN